MVRYKSLFFWARRVCLRRQTPYYGTGGGTLKNRRLGPRYLLLLLIPAALSLLLKSSFFTVRSVNFLWKNPVFAVPDIEETFKSKTLGANIFTVSGKGLLKLVEENPVVKEVNLSKNYPGGISVEFNTREPFLLGYWLNPPPEASVAALLSPDFLSGFLKQVVTSGQPYVLDSLGIVFWKGLESYPDLTPFYIADGSKPVLGQGVEGSQNESGVTFVGQFLEKNRDGDLPAISFLATLDKQSFAVKLRGGPFVFLPVRDSYLELLDALKLIWDKYHIEGKVLKKVDLRFNNPVVEY